MLEALAENIMPSPAAKRCFSSNTLRYAHRHCHHTSHAESSGPAPPDAAERAVEILSGHSYQRDARPRGHNGDGRRGMSHRDTLEYLLSMGRDADMNIFSLTIKKCAMHMPSMANTARLGPFISLAFRRRIYVSPRYVSMAQLGVGRRGRCHYDADGRRYRFGTMSIFMKERGRRMRFFDEAAAAALMTALLMDGESDDSAIPRSSMSACSDAGTYNFILDFHLPYHSELFYLYIVGHLCRHRFAVALAGRIYSSHDAVFILRGPPHVVSISSLRRAKFS